MTIVNYDTPSFCFHLSLFLIENLFPLQRFSFLHTDLKILMMSASPITHAITFCRGGHRGWL